MSKNNVTIFNKGTRSFQLEEGVLSPKGTIEVSADRAAKLLKAYSKELLKGGAPSEVDDKKVAKLEAKIEKLEAENAALLKDLEEATAEPKQDK